MSAPNGDLHAELMPTPKEEMTVRPGISHSKATRDHVAWLLWCANQGYLKTEDRDILSGDGSTFTEDMSHHPDDAAELPGWLDMADSVLAAIDAETPK